MMYVSGLPCDSTNQSHNLRLPMQTHSHKHSQAKQEALALLFCLGFDRRCHLGRIHFDSGSDDKGSQSDRHRHQQSICYLWTQFRNPLPLFPRGLAPTHI